MNKEISFIGIFLTILILTLSGCIDVKNRKDNDNDISSAITTLKYDKDKFEVYNLSVETWGYNNSSGEKIGDGFVSLPEYYEYGEYHIDGKIRNIAGYDLEKVDITKNYYDENNSLLAGSGTTHYRRDGPLGPICEGCTISLYSTPHSNTSTWEQYDHMELIITVIE